MGASEDHRNDCWFRDEDPIQSLIIDVSYSSKKK